MSNEGEQKRGETLDRFEDVFHQYAQPVYRFLLKLTQDECVAEELTQETFYKAFLHINSFRGECSIYTWLCQIGKNLCRNEQKRRKHCSFNELDRSLVSPHNVEAQVIRKEQAAATLDALQRLPELSREVFSLRVFGEMKYKEIAAILGKTETWAKVTFFRAKEQLLKLLEESTWT